jgi:tRNA(Ile)-lysidine synthase
MAAPKSSRSADRSPAGAAQHLTQVLSAFLATRLRPGQRLCVGLSGGRDSVVLLHALSQLALPIELSALHVHHGLSANADAWAAFCAEFCRACAVPLHTVRVDVPRASGVGLEAAAREKRHAAFADCAADWLALAHHRDDQAETVLLNLLRGAGVAGAAGMLPERPQPGGPRLIRPLLDVPRTAIEAYAAQHALAWIDDESNDDVHYRRNYLRRAVMPRLAERFPGAPQALARAAGHFAETAGLLDELARLDRTAVAPQGGGIALAAFNTLSRPRARNLLRFELVSAGFRAPETRWIDEALRQLASARATAETCVSTPDGELHAYRGQLHLVRCRPPVPAEPLLWRGETELPWADGRISFLPSHGAGLSRRLLVGEVSLSPRRGGERLQPDARRPRRTLRNLLQESAVPPWERQRLPFIWCAERLAWVGGLGVDTAFACPPDEDGIQIVWSPSAT